MVLKTCSLCPKAAGSHGPLSFAVDRLRSHARPPGSRPSSISHLKQAGSRGTVAEKSSFSTAHARTRKAWRINLQLHTTPLTAQSALRHPLLRHSVRACALSWWRLRRHPTTKCSKCPLSPPLRLRPRPPGSVLELVCNLRSLEALPAGKVGLNRTLITTVVKICMLVFFM